MIPHLEKATILITGGAGFLGSSFLRTLLQKRSFAGKAINYDLLTYSGNVENLAPIASDPRYLFIKGDIRDSSLLRKLHLEYKIDLIVHFAAETHVDRSIHDPYPFLETNLFGTFALLECIREFPEIHFHHISTDEVYGSIEEGFFDENSPYFPNSPYAASKASSDHFVRAYGQTYQLSTTVSHASNNYGPYQFPEKIIPLMISRCLEGKTLPVYGNGENRRDWLYVDDHSEAVWEILCKGKRGEVYNIGGGREKKNIDLVIELIEIFAELTGHDKKCYLDKITYVADRPGHDFRYVLNPEKMKKEIGWEARTPFQEGLRETVAWYLHNRKWVAHVHSGEYRHWVKKHYERV